MDKSSEDFIMEINIIAGLVCTGVYVFMGYIIKKELDSLKD